MSNLVSQLNYGVEYHLFPYQAEGNPEQVCTHIAYSAGTEAWNVLLEPFSNLKWELWIIKENTNSESGDFLFNGESARYLGSIAGDTFTGNTMIENEENAVSFKIQLLSDDPDYSEENPLVSIAPLLEEETDLLLTAPDNWSTNGGSIAFSKKKPAKKGQKWIFKRPNTTTSLYEV